jgi:hypothetical protein
LTHPAASNKPEILSQQTGTLRLDEVLNDQHIDCFVVLVNSNVLAETVWRLLVRSLQAHEPCEIFRLAGHDAS